MKATKPITAMMMIHMVVRTADTAERVRERMKERHNHKLVLLYTYTIPDIFLQVERLDPLCELAIDWSYATRIRARIIYDIYSCMITYCIGLSYLRNECI